jgi:Carboxypeptidase regulatory-like domain
MTTNAGGTDEWVGIDDINIGCLTVTAASVPVSGRVMSGKGTGVSRAVVTMADDRGNIFSTRTNSFGYYKFDNVTAGNSYVVSVSSKLYQFESQVVSVTDAIADLDFYAQE